MRTTIDAELANGTPSLATIAVRLKTSSRTLQRRLAEEKLSFSQLVDDVRRESALALMADRRFSVAEIAAHVGYQDAYSFRAAFLRWTGVTPRVYRRSSAPR